MVAPFVLVVYYCTYCLNKKTNYMTLEEAIDFYGFKQKIYELYPDLTGFTV